MATELSEQAVAARAEIVIDFANGKAACSPSVLYSIVSNLLANALKYLGDARERRVRLRAEQHGRFVRVEVEDTGPGIRNRLNRGYFSRSSP